MSTEPKRVVTCPYDLAPHYWPDSFNFQRREAPATGDPAAEGVPPVDDDNFGARFKEARDTPVTPMQLGFNSAPPPGVRHSWEEWGLGDVAICPNGHALPREYGDRPTFVVGVAGPPGSGKTHLMAALTYALVSDQVLSPLGIRAEPLAGPVFDQYWSEVVKPLMVGRTALPRTGGEKWAPSMELENTELGIVVNLILFDVAGDLQTSRAALMRSGSHYGVCDAVIYCFDSTLLLGDEAVPLLQSDLTRRRVLDEAEESEVYQDVHGTKEPLPGPPPPPPEDLAEEPQEDVDETEDIFTLPVGSPEVMDSDPLSSLLKTHSKAVRLVGDALHSVRPDANPVRARTVSQPLLVAMTKADRFAMRVPRSQKRPVLRDGVVDVEALEEKTAFGLCALLDHGAQQFYDSATARFDRISCHLVSATGGEAQASDAQGSAVFETVADTSDLIDLLTTFVIRLGFLPDNSEHLSITRPLDV